MDTLREIATLIGRRVGPAPNARWRDERLGLMVSTVRYLADPTHDVWQPVFALVVQGEKQLVLNDHVFTCGGGTFIVSSVDLPVSFRVSAATPEEPYVALVLPLRPASVASLLLDVADGASAPTEPLALGVSRASPELLEAVARLVRLLDHPRDLPVLGPLAEREILWRLLCSEQGARLRQVGLADGRLSQIGRAMRRMRERLHETLPVEELARASAMSVTSFHRHFRAVASMSPLQYQKQLRLQEARTRLLAGADDVTAVGHAVGYDSASQFSREYKRAFGAPPGQDARRIRASHAPAGRGRSAQASK